MLSAPLFAQDNAVSNTPFSLFEPVEAQQSANPNQPVVAPSIQAPSGSGPIFTLVGTSRIGDTRSVIVRHNSGDEVAVPLREFGATPIPGYESFAVVGADAGNLSIRYPGGTTCIEYSDAGVSCSSEGNVALLSLTTADPLVAREPQQQGQSGSGEADAESTDEPENRNPFAILRERARNGDAQAVDVVSSSRRFTPRRIAPEDVPPGMRVVSTPFGDRLVEL